MTNTFSTKSLALNVSVIWWQRGQIACGIMGYVLGVIRFQIYHLSLKQVE